MPDRLVTIGSYATLYEANLVKAELEAFGIDAHLRDAFTVSANWLWSNALGGVKVEVLQSREDEARRLLQAQPSDEPDQPDMPEATTLCPVCGGKNTQYSLDKRGSISTWLILGVPVLPAIGKRACAECGHKWKP